MRIPRNPLLGAAFAAVLIALPTSALAQETGQWYAAVAATVSFPETGNGTIANAPAPGSTVRLRNPFETGYGGSLALGRRFGQVRAEIEAGWVHDRQNRYVAIVPPTGSIPATVDQDTYRGMVNAYFDLTRGPVQPYVGVGIGVARVDLKFVGPRAPLPAEAPRTLIEDSDTRFAYQLIGGVGMRLSRTATLFGQYRYFDPGTMNGRDVRGEPITRTLRDHTVNIGVRLGF